MMMQRQGEALLQVLQQVDHLRLDRDVQRRDRLVADDQLGRTGERAGDADALALAARELVRIAVRVVGPQADGLQQVERLLARALAEPSPCSQSGSPTMSATVMRGLSDENGSWKTICISPRELAQPARAGAPRSWPSNVTEPAVGSISRISMRPTRGLAAAGLADDGQRLALLDRERHAVHGADDRRLLEQAAAARGNAS